MKPWKICHNKNILNILEKKGWRSFGNNRVFIFRKEEKIIWVWKQITGRIIVRYFPS